eukprot:SAG31_NODE_5958_length_2241_cov_3.839869_1_plen_116_part_00
MYRGADQDSVPRQWDLSTKCAPAVRQAKRGASHSDGSLVDQPYVHKSHLPGISVVLNSARSDREVVDVVHDPGTWVHLDLVHVPAPAGPHPPVRLYSKEILFVVFDQRTLKRLLV